MAFDKQKYKTHMRSLKVTQKTLAAALNKDTRTVSRWLGINYTLNSDKILLLCEVLGVEPNEFDPEWQGSINNKNKARVSATVSSASKNGYWLLRQRYGVSEKDLVELAPTMFAVIAEHARQMPHDWWEKWDHLVKQTEILKMPGPYDMGNERETANNEIEALNEDKIFGYEEHENISDPTLPENLFAKALSDLAAESSNVTLSRFSYRGKCPEAQYNIIDKAFLDSITDGDEELNNAISRGDIEIFTEEFENFSSPSERIKWMRKNYLEIKKGRERKLKEWREKKPDFYQLSDETKKLHERLQKYIQKPAAR